MFPCAIQLLPVVLATCILVGHIVNVKTHHSLGKGSQVGGWHFICTSPQTVHADSVRGGSEQTGWPSAQSKYRMHYVHQVGLHQRS